MSTPLEHDYIGLAETSSMERSSEKISSSSSSSSTHDNEDKTTKTTGNTSLNLKETELRLGLPGSHSPERKVSLFGKDLESNNDKISGFAVSPLKNLVSGAKRGFSDAIDGPNGKWVFPLNGKSDIELAKGAVLASPRGGLEGKTNSQQARVPLPAAVKEVAGVPQSPKPVQDKKNPVPPANDHPSAPAAKAQVVGWPPIRSFRKNTMASNSAKNSEDAAAGCLYVKVSMDGAPYLRKVDLKTYKNYMELSSALEKMFSCFTIGQCSSNGLPVRDGLSESRLMDLLHGSEYVLTYKDKDGDWMLVGDVPWESHVWNRRSKEVKKNNSDLLKFKGRRRRGSRKIRMLACRSLLRVDRLLKLTNTYVQSKQANYFQVNYSYQNLSLDLRIGGTKDMDKRKRRIGTPVWKPVCTQASSLEEPVVKDVKVESENGSQMQEVDEAMVEDMDASVSPKASEDDIEDEALKETSVISAARHSLTIEVGASVIRFVRGKDGSTKEKIEKETGVQIILPSSKEEDAIIIEGTSADSVTKASKEIQHIIDEAVKTPSLDYSHFVSLPLAIHPELVGKLVKFQNSILGISDTCVGKNLEGNSDGETSENDAQDQQLGDGSAVAVDLKVADDRKSVKVDLSGIPLVSYASKEPKESKSSKLSDLRIEKSIFIKPKTFHLTVLMLKLWNKERVNLAADVLKSISSKVMDALDNRPLFIRLKGLDCMRGSLDKARVVYAPVEEIGSENRLPRACQVIIDAFVEAGLVLEKDAGHELKLHATVMNAKHRKRRGMRREKSDSFNARGIFKQFGSEEWGEYLIREAHLSQRFKYDENGYYHCCASIPFPENMQF